MKYMELESNKYMTNIDREQWNAYCRYRNAKAIRDFSTFLLGLGAMWVGVYAVQHMDVWKPHVDELLASIGLL